MTSLDPKYIEMFNTPEIQEGWKPKVGDRCCTRLISPKIEYITELNIVHMRHCKTAYIFLPSIEQKVELWLVAKKGSGENNGRHFLFWLNEFLADTSFFENSEAILCDWPLPILVLAFIMDDLHELVWSEKEGWSK